MKKYSQLAHIIFYLLAPSRFLLIYVDRRHLYVNIYQRVLKSGGVCDKIFMLYVNMNWRVFMEAKKLFKYFLLCGSAYFTAICGSILVVLAILTSGTVNAGIEPSQLLLTIPFCFTLSLGSTVRRASAVPNHIGWIINAVCYIGGFLLFLVLCGVNFAPAVIASVIFSCIYFAVALFIAHKEKKRRVVSAPSAPSAKSGKRGKDKLKSAGDISEKTENKPYENLFS